MGWACLAVGVVALVLSLTSLLPLRGAVGSAFTFVPSWIVGEAPLHFLFAVVVAAMLGCGLRGRFRQLAGLAGALVGSGGVCGLRRPVRFRPQVAGLVRVGLWHRPASPGSRGAGARRTPSASFSPCPSCHGAWTRLRNVAYADDDSHAHRLDIYRKAGTVAAPVLLYFHGGAWVMGDKREQGIPMLEHLAGRGFVCVTANYALSPKARWPRHVLDCKLALVWVKRHIAEYGGDPGLVFVSGGSAGGHLAALVALTAGDAAWQPGFEDEDTTVAACIPLYGVYDFVDPEKIGNANLAPILERRVFEVGAVDAYEAASPIARVSESAPPFFVVHGRNDVLVPVSSARAFVAALRARSSQPVSYVELPLTQHGFDNFWSPRTVHFVRALEAFTAAIVRTRTVQREVGR